MDPGARGEIEALRLQLAAAEAREARERRQRECLRRLALAQGREQKPLVDALREITAHAAECLGVERASVWTYTEDRTAISCLDLFERSPARHGSGVRLAAADFPAYFAAIATERAVVAHDACTDAATREFAAPYLVPNGITSMLDAPIRVGGRLLGVVCHEHVGPRRTWQEDEVSFAGSLADLASLAIAAAERRETLDRLREAQERLAFALSASGTGVWAWAPAEDRFDWTPETLALFDVAPDLAADAPADFRARIHPEDRALVDSALRRAVALGSELHVEFRVVRRDGAERRLAARGRVVREPGRPVHLVGVCSDVTERHRAEVDQRALEAKVLHAQKLESLGVLAGGIAHDFNNLLVGILGNASLLLADTPPGAPAHGTLREIRDAGARAAELCRQLLAYSGKGRVETGPVDASALIRETAPLLRLSIGKSVTVRERLADGLPPVLADVAQLRQLVMNLVINASEAIGGGEGTITLATGHRRCDRATLEPNVFRDDLPEGPYVWLEVADTGTGMDPATLARIFDPFFSTKFAGRGLGLAVVQGIVRGHHGGLVVDTAPGRGARFTVYLPAMAGTASPATRSESVTRDTGRWTGGTGTILVVDDEPGVRTVAERILARAGFRVVAAGDGVEAVERFRAAGADVRAVLLDLTMPRMSGAETLRALRAVRAEIPVLVSSGYSEQDVDATLAREPRVGFVQKPYEAATLVRKVRELLGA